MGKKKLCLLQTSKRKSMMLLYIRIQDNISFKSILNDFISAWICDVWIFTPEKYHKTHTDFVPPVKNSVYPILILFIYKHLWRRWNLLRWKNICNPIYMLSLVNFLIFVVSCLQILYKKLQRLRLWVGVYPFTYLCKMKWNATTLASLWALVWSHRKQRPSDCGFISNTQEVGLAFIYLI